MFVNRQVMYEEFHYWCEPTGSFIFLLKYGRSVSVQTRVLRTSICLHWHRTDTNFVNYLSNDHKQSCFQIIFKKWMLKTYKIARKVNVNQDHSVSAYIQTMIKHVFLFNYPHELLMSLIILKRSALMCMKSWSAKAWMLMLFVVVVDLDEVFVICRNNLSMCR